MGNISLGEHRAWGISSFGNIEFKDIELPSQVTGNAEVVDAYRGVHKRSHPCHREERKPHRIRKVPSETEEMVEITDDRSILAR